MIRQGLERSPSDATGSGPGTLPCFQVREFAIQIKGGFRLQLRIR